MIKAVYRWTGCDLLVVFFWSQSRAGPGGERSDVASGSFAKTGIQVQAGSTVSVTSTSHTSPVTFSMDLSLF